MIYQKFLTETLEEASKIANQMFGKVSVKTKDFDASQALTEADLKIGKFIVAEIQKHYPEHNIIDEETGVIDKKSEWTWVTDPIDGTVFFAHGTPFFGVMIGLMKGHAPHAGGVALPFFGGIYIAEKSQGAYFGKTKLDISTLDLASADIIAYAPAGRANNPEMTKKEGKWTAAVAEQFHLAHTGSVFDSIAVAKGQFAGELNARSKVWDNIAQHIIIEEAGGLYTDIYGKPMDYSKALTEPDLNYTYCGGAPGVHKKLQEIIHSVNPSS